ncbi:uncharacterized protein TRIADDRAFT_55547 [Trichoplax adhaerens]|uniref:Uncharacterized protein n=1 Tax=Trichoplax adhaerens TaxID=10228 RepID=B3RV70_TRIAD|nr:predicted protein [Trichoplax adhaerens]EDV25943.1 predicted protein [Trichoplax adhaerens]|eukprot:XP_002111976.1 predicted protein [Trichoplax adhaerens]
MISNHNLNDQAGGGANCKKAIATRSLNNIQTRKKLTRKRTTRYNLKKIVPPREKVVKSSNKPFTKRPKIKVEDGIKRGPGRPRKIQLTNSIQTNQGYTSKAPNTSKVSINHNNLGNNSNGLIYNTNKRKRGRPKGSKNKSRIIYSIPTYKENKLSYPLMDKPIRLNIPKEKSMYILAEINRKIQSQNAPWKI